MTGAVPNPPRELRRSGRRLWREVVEAYDLDAHELALLLEMCRTADNLDELAAAVRAEGAVVDGRPHPALVEARQQRITYARLAAALRLPAGDESDPSALRRPQRRVGARGVYQLRSVR